VRWQMLRPWIKLPIRSPHLFRTRAVVALQGGGVIAVNHNLSHYEQIQLITAHLSEGGSAALVVFDWEEHGARSLLGSN
jgi:hypothetical protein